MSNKEIHSLKKKMIFKIFDNYDTEFYTETFKVYDGN